VPSISLLPLAGRKADALHFDDAVLDDHNVHRPARRRAGAVDDRSAPDDQAIVRAVALALPAIRRGLHLLGSDRNGENRRERGGERQESAQRHTGHDASRAETS
jgi:hypothetical protein